MAPAPAPLGRPHVLGRLFSSGRLAFRLLREPAVSIWTKALGVAPLFYVVWPLDFLPDVLPVLGQLDDLVAVVVAAELFIGLCPREIVDHHRAALAARLPFSPAGPNERVIDAEFRREA
jgi:uncharacterized membrane protein YkvA (DUF1232 family)